MAALDNPAFYDRHWEHTDTSASPEIVAKADRVLRMIPGDVRSIADVGCGDGYLTHRLAERFDVTAVDRSEVALARVRCRAIQASADDLPLPDRSVDLAFSSEMLEHLPDETLARAARELARISRRWVFVTVPHGENLALRITRCPACGHEFNVYSHLQSLDAPALDAMFPDFVRVATAREGPHEPSTYAPLERLRQRAARRYMYWTGARFTCPRCGNQEFSRAERNAGHRAIEWTIDRATDALNRVLGRRGGPYWLLALYRRKGAPEGGVTHG